MENSLYFQLLIFWEEGGGAGFRALGTFSLLLFSNSYQFLVEVSKLIAVTIPGEDNTVFTAEAVISFRWVFDS